MPKRNKTPRHVLVSRLSALGDVAMTIPSLYNACRANPDTKFYFLTRPRQTELFVNAPANLTLLAPDLKQYRGVAGMWRLARKLRRDFAIDTYLDLHDVLRTQLLRTFLSLQGVKCRFIHKERRKKHLLTRSRSKVLVPLIPTTQRYEDVYRRAGIHLADDFRSLFGRDKGSPLEFVDVSGPKREGEKWIAIAPFAKHSGKIYPFEEIAKVAEYYAAKENYKIFIFGFGREENEKIATLSRRFPNVVNMAAAGLGMGAELALLSHCDVMLSMDSANMHLASLVGLRAVSVWGATHPYAGFMGWGQKEEDAVQLDMTCRPCSVFGDKPCLRGDYHCLRGISPRMIIARMESK